MEQKQLEQLSAEQLEELVRHHNRLYWDEQKPEISDYEYDRLVRRLRDLAPSAPVLEQMGPMLASAEPGATVRHAQRMLSLDKCYSEEDLRHWAESFEGAAVASPKFDGVACSIHYDDRGDLSLAATRGDGEQGENVTANAREIADIPKHVNARSIEVRGEVFMKLSVFQGFKDQGFANPRNLTASAIKMKNASESAERRLSFAAYDLLGTDHRTEAEKMDYLAQIGFPPVERSVVEKEGLQKAYEVFAEKRDRLDYEIDGVVFRVNSVAEQRRLGATAHHPRYAIAYKFQGESAATTLLDVKWSVARSGAITPIALLEPVALSGVTVKKASLHHAGFIRKLGLTKNARVFVTRRGGVIPKIEFVAEPGHGEIEIPTQCPSCGGPVVLEKDFLRCADPDHCKPAVVGQLQHFAETAGMKGFGEVFLSNAFDKGLLVRPADFYSLTEEKLLSLDRVAEKGARNLLAAVDGARRMDLATFLRAFGLQDLGPHVSGILAEHFGTLDRIFQVTEQELGAIHSVGEVTASTVVRALAEARPDIEAVRQHVEIVEAKAPEPGAATGPFAGMTFVFTGKMAMLERKDAEKLVRKLGGVPNDAVSKTLTFLVIGDKKTPEKSTKQKAAEKLVAQGAPIQVISEGEFLQKVEAVREG